jgi:hypothetical protein
MQSIILDNGEREKVGSQKLNMVSSLRERTAQNARSFKLSSVLRDVQTLFYDNWLIAQHSFSFTQKIKDHSSLLSVRSIYKSDVPSSGYHQHWKSHESCHTFHHNTFVYVVSLHMIAIHVNEERTIRQVCIFILRTVLMKW